MIHRLPRVPIGKALYNDSIQLRLMGMKWASVATFVERPILDAMNMFGAFHGTGPIEIRLNIPHAPNLPISHI